MKDPVSTKLTESILNLQQGDHLCLFYDRDPGEQMPALIPFILDALERDEQFCYVADDQTVEELAERLRQGGVNVGQEQARRRLQIWTRAEWREPGQLSTEKMAGQVRRYMEEGLAAGFKGVRFAVEMTWTLGPEIEARRLEDWEATINTIFVPGTPGRIICQYNRSRLAPDAMMAALHTHPLAILGDRVCPNVFYRAPLILGCKNGEAGEGAQQAVSQTALLDWMISQLERARAMEEEREELLARLRRETAREIAGRKRAEQERRAMNEYLSRLLSLMPVGVYACDREGGITFYNEPAVQIWGERPSTDRRFCACHRMSLPDGTPLQAGDGPMAMAVTEGKSFRDLEVTVERCDGTRITAGINIDPIWDEAGQLAGAISVFQDITARKKAEEASRRLAAIVESSEDAIVGKNLNGIIMSWNQGAERLFGYSAEEMIGRHITTLIPIDRHDEEKVIMSRIRKGERVDHYETVRQRKNGSLIEISLTVSPIKDEKGNIIGASKIARDVSARKIAEEALRLQHQMLTEMDQRKNEFLAMLGHELRNPMSAIQNAAELLGDDSDEETLQWATNIVRRQTSQLSRLVDDLVDVARITRGKVELRRELVDLSSVIARAAETTRSLMAEHRHSLAIVMPEPAETMVVSGDSTRIEQIIVNLLTNAAKYTDAHGKIRMEVKREGNEAVVAVRDNGIGISSDLLPRIFELFVQDARGLDRSRGGLGIGLALAKRFAEMLGGTLTARSDGPDCGSEFSLRLPIVNNRVAAPVGSNGKVDSSENQSRRRILLVDDNKDSVQTLARLLSRRGHQVQVAYDGSVAVRLAHEFRPDAFLLDLGLPGMSGYQLARVLRHAGFFDALFVAISGYAQREDIANSRRAGFQYHFPKPVDIQRIAEVLSEPAQAQGREECFDLNSALQSAWQEPP